MTRIRVIRLFAVVAALGLTMTVASADEQVDQFSTRMTGFNETPPILTNGHGSFHATLQGTIRRVRLANAQLVGTARRWAV